MKNTLQEIHSRLDETEVQISNLEDKVEKHPIRAGRRKQNLKNEDSVSNLWDHMKYNNNCIIGVPEGEQREQWIKNLFEEIMTENFPNLVKETLSIYYLSISIYLSIDLSIYHLSSIHPSIHPSIHHHLISQG